MSDTVEDVLQQETMADAVPNKVKVPDTATQPPESVTEAEASPAKKAEKATSLLAGFEKSLEMNMKFSQMNLQGVNVADLRAWRASGRPKKVEDNGAKAVTEPEGVMKSDEKTAIEPPKKDQGPPPESLKAVPDTMKEEKFNKTMSDTVQDVLQQGTMADAVPNKVNPLGIKPDAEISDANKFEPLGAPHPPPARIQAHVAQSGKALLRASLASRPCLRTALRSSCRDGSRRWTRLCGTESLPHDMQAAVMQVAFRGFPAPLLLPRAGPGARMVHCG